MHAGEGLAERCRHLPLVPGVGEGEEQAHRHRLGPVGAHALDRAGHRGRVERDQNPLGAAALGDLVAAVVRDERGRVVGVEAVEGGAGLAPQLEQVAEAPGRDEGGARARALEQRIGPHGHPVAEGADVGGLEAGLREGRQHGGHDRLALVVRGGRHLGRDQAPARDDHRVGEGAADVNADQGAFGR